MQYLTFSITPKVQTHDQATHLPTKSIYHDKLQRLFELVFFLVDQYDRDFAWDKPAIEFDKTLYRA